MGGFLQGILGAAGEDIVRERKQRYAEDLNRHQMRLQFLSDAAQHAQTPEQRAEAFRQMDEINNEPIGGGGKRSAGKRGQPGRFEQMGQMLQALIGNRGTPGASQGGIATPPFLPPGQNAPEQSGGGVFKSAQTAEAPTPIPNAIGLQPTPTPIPNAPATPPAMAPIPNVQIPQLPPSRFNAIFGTQEQAEGLEERGARRKMARELDELRGKGAVGLEMSDSAIKQKLGHVSVVSDYLKKQGVDAETAREEAERIVFGKAVITGAHNMSQVLFKRPETGDEIFSGWADPRKPGSVFDANTGERLESGTFTLIDKGLASVAERGKYWGEFGNYYRSALGRGMADHDARRAAGDMVMKKYGVTLGRTEQQMAIDQALSGIGQGPGIPPSAVVPPAPTPGTGGNVPRVVPGVTPSALARPTPTGGGSSLTPPLPPRRTAGTGGTPLTQGGLTPRENDDVLAYLSSITGTQKGASKASQVRQQNGLRAIARATGLDPMTLTARLTETPALAKQISETIQRAGAIQRLNNTIETHGRILNGVVQTIAQTNSPLLNKPVREWRRRLAGSPELKRFEVARNEIAREYAYLTAGGAQSRAMLPVGVESKMDKLFSDDITPAEAAALVDQIGIGARTEKQMMDKTVRDLQEQMMRGPAGQATGAAGKTVPAPEGGSNTSRPKVRIISVQ